MARNPNIAVITIGYRKYAFENAEQALSLMAVLSSAISVDSSNYGMEKITDCTHFLSDDSDLPELKFVPASKFNPHQTREEVKAQYEREQADRQDVDQQMHEAPVGLPAPAIEAEEEEPIF